MYSMNPINRSYSITSSKDITHISNGRCPNYALTWCAAHHNPHWSVGHDYFMGNGENINDGTKELREILSKRLTDGKLDMKHIVFCDLDGVLADFKQGVINKFRKCPDQLQPSIMWSVINKSEDFFETLPWMPKGQEFWSRIEQYDPIILTGVPRGSTTAVEQKKRWCERELGPHVPVIACYTKEKPNYCLQGSILIDDRTDNLDAWKEKGGKFVLYHEVNLDIIVERIDRHMETDLPSP